MSDQGQDERDAIAALQAGTAAANPILAHDGAHVWIVIDGMIRGTGIARLADKLKSIAAGLELSMLVSAKE